MTLSIVIVLIVLATTFGLIATEELRAELASVGACCVLLLTHVLTPAVAVFLPILTALARERSLAAS